MNENEMMAVSGGSLLGQVGGAILSRGYGKSVTYRKHDKGHTHYVTRPASKTMRRVGSFLKTYC